MAELLLNDDETSLFITLWEQFPELWNPQHTKYKNRVSRNLALRQIADLFSKNWTTDEVSRKIESLKAYYRKQKKKNTGSAGSQVKWIYFDRIVSFCGGTLYVPDGAVISSVCPGDGEQEEDSQSDLQKLMIDLQNRCKSTESSQIITIPSTLNLIEIGPGASNLMDTLPKGPTIKRARKILAEKSPGDSRQDKTRQEFQENALSLLKDISNSSLKESPNMNYAITVAKRLDILKNKKKLFFS